MGAPSPKQEKNDLNERSRDARIHAEGTMSESSFGGIPVGLSAVWFHFRIQKDRLWHGFSIQRRTSRSRRCLASTRISSSAFSTPCSPSTRASRSSPSSIFLRSWFPGLPLAGIPSLTSVARRTPPWLDRDTAIGNLLKTAGLLKAKGFSDKDIAAITGLDFDTIGNLPDNS